jgi:hypothetical protein
LNNYLGEYPVISVDFKNVIGNDYSTIYNQAKIEISGAFKQHKQIFKYLLAQDVNNHNIVNGTSYSINGTLDLLIKLTEDKNISLSDDSSKFKIIYIDYGEKATFGAITNSLKFLSEVLYERFQKNVYILYDEYDAPVNHFLTHTNISTTDFDETLFFLKLLMQTTFKGNTFLEKGLITGILIVVGKRLAIGAKLLCSQSRVEAKQIKERKILCCRF